MEKSSSTNISGRQIQTKSLKHVVCFWKASQKRGKVENNKGIESETFLGGVGHKNLMFGVDWV